jgi:hypothetical protein
MKTQLLTVLLMIQGLIAVSAYGANPVVTFNGYQNTSICSGQYAYLLDGTIVTDTDGDQISITSVISSNSVIINPANLSGYFQTNSGSPNYESVGYYYGTIGNVGSATNVDLTYTFSDGTNSTTLTVTYLVKNSPNPVFLNSNYEVCSSLGSVMVNDWVYPSGGYFEIDGEETFYDGIFHVEDYTYPTTVDLGYVYTSPNGCSVTTNTNVTIHIAPQIELYPSDASSCVSGDGSMDASIYSDAGSNYTFVWNDGNTTETDRTGLLPGSYHIDVTDEDGCISEASGSIGLTGVSFNETVDSVTCANDGDGAIQLNITGLSNPLSIYWSSGQTSESITNVPAGVYTIYVSDAAGCNVSKTFNVPQPDLISAYVYSYPPSSCSSADGSAYISGVYGGNGNYSYEWSTGETTSSIYGLPTGPFDLTITDQYGCSNTMQYAIYDYNAPYTYLDEIVPTACGAEDGAIYLDTMAFGSPIFFDWSNGETTLDVDHLAAGDYVLHVYNTDGCDGYEFYTIPTTAPLQQPLCMISVDSATTTNIVVWEKVDAANVDYYKIYRETINPNEFVAVGTVSNSAESIFNDVNASPIAQSWRYKITAVDACGVEGPASSAHKTMHITTIDLGNGDFQAIWNPYYGIEYDAYKLFRYTASTGWEEIATLPSVINNYYDTPTNAVDLDYMVELDIELSCVADYLKAQDFNTTRSNKDKGNFSVGEGTGDSNNELGEESITMEVYPNPVSSTLTVSVSANGMNKTMHLVTVDGQIVQTSVMHSVVETIDMSHLSNGLYFLKIEGQNATIPVVKN